MDKSIYNFVKIISFLIRYALCCVTIEQVVLFESEAAQWIWSLLFGGALYSILRLLCYAIVGVVIKHFPTNSSWAKSLLYFSLYVVVVLIVFGILKFLTRFGVLPISIEITFNLKELVFNFAVWIAEKVQAILQCIFNVIIRVTEGISEACILAH